MLDRHCDAEGRDPSTVERTILYTGSPLDDPDAFVRSMAAYAALGVSLVEVMPMGDPVAFATEVATRIVPAVADLEA